MLTQSKSEFVSWCYAGFVELAVVDVNAFTERIRISLGKGDAVVLLPFGNGVRQFAIGCRVTVQYINQGIATFLARKTCPYNCHYIL